jgi:arylsulfatase A-like enzyme
MTPLDRRLRLADLRAPLFAVGVVVLFSLAFGWSAAKLQGVAGHLFWRVVVSVQIAVAPWGPALAAAVAVQFALLVFLFGRRRRAALALGSGWLLAAVLFNALPDIVRRLVDRIPVDRLPVFAREPEAMAAFVNNIVAAVLRPDRLWDTFLDRPTLWLIPLLAPLLLGLLMTPAWLLPLRRWSALDAVRLHLLPWTVWLGVVVAAGLAPLAATGLTRPDPGDAPHVILISVDTLRRDMVGIYQPGERSVTPNLDALARTGAVLDDVRAPSSWTLPSHAAMLTGRLPWRLGVRNVTDKIGPDAVTLAERFAATGYDTHAVVTHMFVDAPYGFDQGFDAIDHPPTEAAPAAVDDAVAWLSGRKRPSFLFVHLYDPHWPYDPPADTPSELLVDAPTELRAQLDAHTDAFAFIEALRSGPPELTRAALVLYRAEIWGTDRELGRLFTAAAASKRPALVVVVSDHGEMFGRHDMYGHGLTLFEGEVRVPGIMTGPGVPPGRRVPGPISLIDLAPTLDELTGRAPLSAYDGRSFASGLATGRGQPPRWLAGENHSLTDDPVRYLCDSAWKWQSGIDAPIKGRRVHYEPGWYDLSSDPHEDVRLTPDEGVPHLADMLQLLFSGGSEAGGDVTLSPAERDRLRTLGYLP